MHTRPSAIGDSQATDGSVGLRPTVYPANPSTRPSTHIQLKVTLPNRWRANPEIKRPRGVAPLRTAVLSHQRLADPAKGAACTHGTQYNYRYEALREYVGRCASGPKERHVAGCGARLQRARGVERDEATLAGLRCLRRCRRVPTGAEALLVWVRGDEKVMRSAVQHCRAAASRSRRSKRLFLNPPSPVAHTPKTGQKARRRPAGPAMQRALTTLKRRPPDCSRAAESKRPALQPCTSEQPLPARPAHNLAPRVETAADSDITWKFCDPKRTRSGSASRAPPPISSQAAGRKKEQQVEMLVGLMKRGKQRRQEGVLPAALPAVPDARATASPRSDLFSALQPSRAARRAAAASDAAADGEAIDDLLDSLRADSASSSSASRSGQAAPTAAAAPGEGAVPPPPLMLVAPAPSHGVPPSGDPAHGEGHARAEPRGELPHVDVASLLDGVVFEDWSPPRATPKLGNTTPPRWRGLKRGLAHQEAARPPSDDD